MADNSDKADKDNRWSFIPGSRGPIEIDHAEGVFLYTKNGRRILDAAGGAIVSNIGHGRVEVGEAIAAASARESYVVPPFETESRRRLVDRLRASWLPDSLNAIWLGSGGSDTIDSAIRLARQHAVAKGEPERSKILGRELSYHGTTVTTLSAGRQHARRSGLEPMLADWPTAPACYCLRCPFEQTYPRCGVRCVEDIERVIEEADPRTIAAVIAEPIGGSTAAALTPPDEYWPRLSEICTKHGILLIADEVMTGFGRTGRRFAVDHWNVVPDILVAGKGLAGGYAAIGGLYAREEVVAPLARAGQDLMFYTFGALPASCAAADKVLEIMEREKLVSRANQMGQVLRARLAKLEDHPNVAEIRGRGLMIGIEFVKDRDRLTHFAEKDHFTNRIVAAGLSEGAFFYPSGIDPARDAIMLGPPLTISEDEIELLVSVLETALESALRYTSSRS
jgi:adenosylmethionine-8-amino-7-oxononanoate aminotransferase